MTADMSLKVCLRSPRQYGCLFRLKLPVAGIALAAHVGCTSSSTLTPQGANAFRQARGDLIEVRDANGERVQIDPNTEVRLHRRDGAISKMVEVADLCRSQEGLFFRVHGESCQGAQLLARWEDIESVDVDGFDAAGTTVIVAGIVIVVVGVAAVVLAGAKGGGGKPSVPGSKAERVPAKPSTGTSSPQASAPATPPASPPSHSHSHSSVSVHVGGPIFIPGPMVGGGGDYVGGGASPYAPGQVQTMTADPLEPVFSSVAVRRASVRVLGALDVGGCVYPLGACVAGGARAGVRFQNFLEISAGARALSGWGLEGQYRWTPTLGVGMHGEFPRARELALAFGLEAGGLGAAEFTFAVRPGLRYAPVRNATVGIFPVSPMYVSWGRGRPDEWLAPTSFEFAGTF